MVTSRAGRLGWSVDRVAVPPFRGTALGSHLWLVPGAGADPEKLQGQGHESQWCPYLYPKFKNSTDFGHFISVVPHFQFFFVFFLLLS